MTSRPRSLTLVLALALALVPAGAAQARTLQAFTTQVTPARINLGASFRDVATLTPPIDSSTPTGSVTFEVFGPGNPTCVSGDGLSSVGVTFSSTNPVVTDDSGTTTATSDAFRPVRAGTYEVVAFYGGDDGFASASTSCGDPGESVHVTQTISVSGGGGAAPPVPPVPPVPPTPPTPPSPPPPGAPPSGAPGAPGGLGPPPLLATGLSLSTTSAQLSSTIDPNGLATTMHFELAPILGGLATASAITYVSRTPEQSVGADTTGHTVTFVANELLPNTTYHLRAVARNAAGLTLGQDATFKTPKDPPPPPPVLGKSFNAEPINGRVLFLMPRHRKGVGYVPLTEPRQLPVGTIVNTTSGVARVTTAKTTARRGKLQSGNFGGGVFSLLQNRNQRGLTELGLQVTSKARQQCAATGKARTAAKRALPKTVLTLLRARAKGSFVTRGRFSSATVRGTIWTTADRCDGTLTLVKRGVVAVTDLRLRKTVLVRAGQAYLAKAP